MPAFAAPVGQYRRAVFDHWTHWTLEITLHVPAPAHRAASADERHWNQSSQQVLQHITPLMTISHPYPQATPDRSDMPMISSFKSIRDGNCETDTTLNSSLSPADGMPRLTVWQ